MQPPPPPRYFESIACNTPVVQVASFQQNLVRVVVAVDYRVSLVHVSEHVSVKNPLPPLKSNACKNFACTTTCANENVRTQSCLNKERERLEMTCEKWQPSSAQTLMAKDIVFSNFCWLCFVVASCVLPKIAFHFRTLQEALDVF